MPTVSRFVFACAAALLLCGGGCSSAYHQYSDCYIDCRYCPLPPLPYVHYNDCVCRSCAAAQHLATQPKPVESDSDQTE